jgi:hypothetical protein
MDLDDYPRWSWSGSNDSGVAEQWSWRELPVRLEEEKGQIQSLDQLDLLPRGQQDFECMILEAI